MKTAKQTLDGMLGKNEYPTYTPSAMIEFAQKHVTLAVKAILDKVSLTDYAQEFLQEGASDAIDKDSILNAYPLTNIK